MSVWSTIRAVAGTALAWAAPWGVLGGSSLLAFEIFRAPRGIPFDVYLSDGGQLFLVGLMYGGFFGAIAGSIFAWRLRAWARASATASLAVSHVVGLGATSGAVAVAAPMLVWAVAGGRPAFVIAPMIALAAAAGAGSAYALLAIVHRPVPDLPTSSQADAPLLGDLDVARSEVEVLLAESHDRTRTGADGRRR